VVSTEGQSEVCKRVLCEGLFCRAVMHPCHGMRRETNLQTILRTVLDQIPGRSFFKDHGRPRIGPVKFRGVSSAAVPTASQPHLTALRLHFSDHRIFGSFARQACRCRHM